MSEPKAVEKSSTDVQQSEKHGSPSPTALVEKKRQSWEKLSVWNIAMLIFGTVAIAASVAILSFLWAGAAIAIKGGEPPRFWRTILDASWMTRVVTLCSVVLRLGTGLQLGVFTAVVAALILERVGVPLADLPHLSMIRCSNTGPNSLIKSVGRSFRVRSQFGYSILILLAIINAFILQFTSTILLTDFKFVKVVSLPSSNRTQFGLTAAFRKGDTQTYQGNDFWKSGPTTYQRFAEYRVAGPQGDGYVDTGRTYRGYVPFSTLDRREALREYTGPATVVDMRVVCLAPKVSNVTVDTMTDTIPTISGTLGWENHHPALREKNSTKNFRCALPVHQPTSMLNISVHYWPLGLCKMGFGFGELSEGLRTDWEPSRAQNTSAYLLLNVTGGYMDWLQAAAAGNASLEHSQSKGPWATYNHEEVGVSTSLCFLNPTPHDYDVNIWSAKDSFDPSLGWYDDSGTYVTREIRKLFGATGESLSDEDRGIYHLDPATDWAAAQVEKKHNVVTEDFVWSSVGVINNHEVMGFGNIASTWLLTPYTSLESVHRSHYAVFQDIIHDTQNPALAVQTLFTTLVEMAYYDFLPQFDANLLATTRMSGLQEIPAQWKAFWVIISLLALHFVLVTIAVALFVARTEASLLGNGWQAVLQVVSENTAHVSEHGHALTDREVEELMNDDGRVRIAKSTTSGRLEAMAHRRSRLNGQDLPLDQI